MIDGKLTLLDHSYRFQNGMYRPSPGADAIRVKSLTFQETHSGAEIEVLFATDRWEEFQRQTAAQAGIAVASAQDLRQLMNGHELPAMAVPKGRVRR